MTWMSIKLPVNLGVMEYILRGTCGAEEHPLPPFDDVATPRHLSMRTDPKQFLAVRRTPNRLAGKHAFRQRDRSIEIKMQSTKQQ
jgi:hypothetical protein